MDSLYPYFLLAHIVCAIIFLGFIFTDVVLLSPIRRLLGDEVADKVFAIISRRGVKIMPLCLVLLFLSGGAMISRYVGSTQGFFETPMQVMLVVKMLLAFAIMGMVIISLGCKFLGVRNPLGRVIHPIALCLGFIIVVLAKMAFFISF